MIALSALLGTAVLAGAWEICRVAGLRVAKRDRQLVAMESARQQQLERSCSTYRWFGGLACELGQASWLRRFARSSAVKLGLSRRGETRPFLVEEFLGVKAVEGLLAGVVLAALWQALAGNLVQSVALALVAPPVYLHLAIRTLVRRGLSRMALLAARLPFAIDSLALMLDAGATLPEAIATSAGTSTDNPVSEEFREVLSAVHRGATFRQAVEDMDNRLKTPAVQELAAATLIAQDLGAPLSAVLQQLAEQMRVRRAQEIEVAAGQAQVKLTQPATLMLVASMIAVVCPFVLPVLANLSRY